MAQRRTRRIWQIVQLHHYELVLLVGLRLLFDIFINQQLVQGVNKVVLSNFWPDALVVGGEEPALAVVLQEQGGAARCRLGGT